MTSSQYPSALPNSAKELSEYSFRENTPLPSIYFTRSPAVAETEPVVNEQIPIIDISLLKDGTPDERSRIIHEIGRACEEWGCFTVVNHNISESLQKLMMEAFSGFFNFTLEEKEVYNIKNMFDPIVYGTSTNLLGKDVKFWRDFLRVFFYPVHNYPAKPHDFRTISEEYAHQTREICNELLRSIWQSLELEASFIEEYLELKSCSQAIVGNLYPPCPQPELVLGLPPHSDPCFLTLLTQTNAFNGLQVLHDGKWVVVELIPDSFLVLIGDIIEIVSNGRYKSIVHRVLVSSEGTRISVGASLTPPAEHPVIAPAPKLLESSNSPTVFPGITFKEFFALKLQNQSNKSVMDLIKQ